MIYIKEFQCEKCLFSYGGTNGRSVVKLGRGQILNATTVGADAAISHRVVCVS